MVKLPHSDELFLRFFDPWYGDADREQKGFKTTRPDVLTTSEYLGASAASKSRLTPTSQAEVMRRIEVITQSAQTDWTRTLNLTGSVDLSWIQQIDEHYRPKRIAELLMNSNPEDFSNDYLVTCCEFGALLGRVIKGLQPRLFWLPEWPYWESSLVDPASGSVIPVFHWAIKKMSSYGWDDGFAEKIEMCLDLLDQRVSKGF